MTDFDAERHTAEEFTEMQRVDAEILLRELHDRVGSFLGELDDCERSQHHFDGLADSHSRISRFLLNQAHRFYPRQFTP